jgi:hypothetical protein
MVPEDAIVADEPKILAGDITITAQPDMSRIDADWVMADGYRDKPLRNGPNEVLVNETGRVENLVIKLNSRIPLSVSRSLPEPTTPGKAEMYSVPDPRLLAKLSLHMDFRSFLAYLF